MQLPVQQPDANPPQVAGISSTDWLDDTLEGGTQADEAIPGSNTVSRAEYCPITTPQTSVNSGASRETGSLQHLFPYVCEQPSAAQASYYPDPPPNSSTPDSATGHSADSPTSKWLDLLIADATLNRRTPSEFPYDANGPDIFGNSVLQTPVLRDEARTASADDTNNNGSDVPCLIKGKTGASTRNAYLGERTCGTRDQQREKEQVWEASEPIGLQSQEHILFRHFVEHISQWVSALPRQGMCFIAQQSGKVVD